MFWHQILRSKEYVYIFHCWRRHFLDTGVFLSTHIMPNGLLDAHAHIHTRAQAHMPHKEMWVWLWVCECIKKKKSRFIDTKQLPYFIDEKKIPVTSTALSQVTELIDGRARTRIEFSALTLSPFSSPTAKKNLFS